MRNDYLEDSTNVSDQIKRMTLEESQINKLAEGATFTNKQYLIFLEKFLSNWNYSKLSDEFCAENANSKHGGISFKDKELISTMRGVGWDLIKQIGKKIISGDFNLTTISIPVKVMIPLTMLQTIAKGYFNYPFYLNLAALQQDSLERFKFVIIACLSCYHSSSHFCKPFNPILGETYEMHWEDGSRIYLEQTSHHPPVSHYLMIGPDSKYRYYGYSNFSSSAGINSLKLYNKGKRTVEFKGSSITYNFGYELYSNTFWGSLRLETLGEIAFTDTTNGFQCVIKFDSVKKKPSDFFQAEIKFKDKVVSQVYGSYMSFIEFDGKRYWDIRENPKVNSYEVPNQLVSSSIFREDLIKLAEGNLELAQAAKEKLENVQRADKKLREAYTKKSKKK